MTSCGHTMELPEVRVGAFFATTTSLAKLEVMRSQLSRSLRVVLAGPIRRPVQSPGFMLVRHKAVRSARIANAFCSGLGSQRRCNVPVKGDLKLKDVSKRDMVAHSLPRKLCSSSHCTIDSNPATEAASRKLLAESKG